MICEAVARVLVDVKLQFGINVRQQGAGPSTYRVQLLIIEMRTPPVKAIFRSVRCLGCFLCMCNCSLFLEEPFFGAGGALTRGCDVAQNGGIKV